MLNVMLTRPTVLYSEKCPPTRSVLDYQTEDFVKMNLTNVVDSDLVNICGSVDRAWDLWHSKTMNIINKHIPQIYLKRTVICHGLTERLYH